MKYIPFTSLSLISIGILTGGCQRNQTQEIRDFINLNQPSGTNLSEFLSHHTVESLFAAANEETWGDTPIGPWVNAFADTFSNSPIETWAPSFREIHGSTEINFSRLSTLLALEKVVDDSEATPKFFLSLISLNQASIGLAEVQLLGAASNNSEVQTYLLSIFLDASLPDSLRHQALINSIQRGALDITYSVIISFVQSPEGSRFFSENKQSCLVVLGETLKAGPLLGVDCSEEVLSLVNHLPLRDSGDMESLISQMPLLSSYPALLNAFPTLDE